MDRRKRLGEWCTEWVFQNQRTVWLARWNQ